MEIEYKGYPFSVFFDVIYISPIQCQRNWRLLDCSPKVYHYGQPLAIDIPVF